jgi:glutamate decarboxylase
MVHLQPIPTDHALKAESVAENLGLDSLRFEPGEDEFTTSVYGSRFAAEDLPKVEMPEKEMPKEVAYRMIKLVWSIQIDKNVLTAP